ncbi:hypothetical protein GCK32_007201 [Trichostrongylus colubriformis]|uniref:Abnormal cell migration protein 18-like fibronectin type I domain-containing protein n=1 Tax=Trichostrongylus colubriformis TaxID=6319 RepID=A0AAN8ISM1_TRICO
MSKMTVKLIQLFLLYLCLQDALATDCTYNGKKHSVGETWVDSNESAKKKCTKTEAGWSVINVACVTPKGTEVAIGKSVTEDDKEYTCEEIGGGNLYMKWSTV